ncbi:tyrosine-type recombinase/integrase [Sporosarcina luteola]|uniref:tyrosine-type recombinase/integrase n=1 Tax=Sporosarcina luteola TaxID=582850 RepID=UPI00203E1A58|nr:tyrosine-type recombinase/integrase [Sporosarcina luteola]MCM3742924.1 tyrosine-type recombinase/integrase [Sporosarcina luteola]
MELEDVLEEYRYHCLAKGFTEKTMRNKRQELNQMKTYLMEKRAITDLESVTVHDMRAFIRRKQIAGLQPQSIVAMIKLISAFFNWCISEEYLVENPMTKVEKPKVPKKIMKGFTPQDIHKMIDSFTYKSYLEARNKAIIAMLADCGLRSMEIRGLRSINVNDTTIMINGKGNKERIVFISPVLKKILIRYERLRKQFCREKMIINSDRYFLTYLGEGLSHVALYNVVKEAGERAGIVGKRVSPHTFRHFYAVQALSTGQMDVYSLSRILGHSDIATTQRYLTSLSDIQLQDKAVSSSPLMNLFKGDPSNE